MTAAPDAAGRHGEGTQSARQGAPVTWPEDAECRGMDTRLFFTPGPHPAAVAACRRCAVAAECLQEAVDLGDTAAYRGGTTGAERARAMRSTASPGCGPCGPAVHPDDLDGLPDQGVTLAEACALLGVDPGKPWQMAVSAALREAGWLKVRPSRTGPPLWSRPPLSGTGGGQDGDDGRGAPGP